MTVRELLARVTARELLEWAAFLRLEAEEQEKATKTLTNGRSRR